MTLEEIKSAESKLLLGTYDRRVPHICPVLADVGSYGTAHRNERLQLLCRLERIGCPTLVAAVATGWVSTEAPKLNDAAAQRAGGATEISPALQCWESRKNTRVPEGRRFVSGHDVTVCGTTLRDADCVSGHDVTVCGTTLREGGCVSGHDFSRAERPTLVAQRRSGPEPYKVLQRGTVGSQRKRQGAGLPRLSAPEAQRKLAQRFSAGKAQVHCESRRDDAGHQARLQPLRFVSGHDFTACGTTPRQGGCVSGHDFSRAECPTLVAQRRSGPEPYKVLQRGTVGSQRKRQRSGPPKQSAPEAQW